MRAEFFLTDLDPRARVKGSRDPLGLQAVWAALGREVIGNLTTVTQSVRGFTTLLVGLHLAERAADKAKHGSPVSCFLMWEQLAGYARYSFHAAQGLLGQRKIVARTQSGRATLSAGPEDQILGNQRSYGLWGLYTSAARSSGLIEMTAPSRLTPVGHAVVIEHHLRKLEPGWGSDAKRLVELLAQESAVVTIRRADNGLKAIASMLAPQLTPDEAPIYTRHLVDGGPADTTGGMQRRLAMAMRRVKSDTARELAAAADDELSLHLRKIADAESALAPTGALFSYLLTQDGRSVEDIARDVADTWGSELESVSLSAASVLDPELAATAEALRQGDYDTTIELLVKRNKTVMAERGGSAAWVTLGGGRKLKVRFRDDTSGLPRGDDVRRLWRNPYFLPSLWNVMNDIEPVAA